mmetsp:Transcript_33183/g.63708  ORF Transcript_33183/g.63708 Transcript_33183/m.63708 type:complete len:454 (+) Transcript_33183:394-1755(+)
MLNPELLEHSCALRQRGNAHYVAGRVQAANSDYKSAISLLVDNLEGEDAALSVPARRELVLAASNSAACYLAEQRFSEAVAACSIALKQDPCHVKALYRRACARLGEGSTTCAAADLCALLRAEPDNAEARNLLEKINREPTSSSASLPSSNLEVAQQVGAATDQGPPPRKLFPKELRERVAYVPPPPVNGSPRQPATNLLLLLHGVGDTAAPFATMARTLQLPHTAALALQGPLLIPETDGGSAWFRVFDDDWELIEGQAGETRRIHSLAHTLHLMQELIHNLYHHGWPYSHIHLLGFSNGGTVVLELARRFIGMQRLGGIVAVSASFLRETISTFSNQPPLEYPPTRVLITHGKQDQVVSARDVQQTAAMLRSLHPQARADVETYDKGHCMPRDGVEMHSIMKFWSETLKAPAPPCSDDTDAVSFEIGQDHAGRESVMEAMAHSQRSQRQQ